MASKKIELPRGGNPLGGGEFMSSGGHTSLVQFKCVVRNSFETVQRHSNGSIRFLLRKFMDFFFPSLVLKSLIITPSVHYKEYDSLSKNSAAFNLQKVGAHAALVAPASLDSTYDHI